VCTFINQGVNWGSYMNFYRRAGRVPRSVTPGWFARSWQLVVELVVAVVGRYILVVAGPIRHIAGRSVGMTEDWPLDVVLTGRGPTQQQWKP